MVYHQGHLTARGFVLQFVGAALTAIVELTHTPDIVMPGMMAVVVASLVASEVFGKQSLFLTMLRAGGKDYDASPVLQALRRVGVASVMSRGFVRVDPSISLHLASAIAESETDWILIDLNAIPAERLQLAPVSLQANLQEAYHLLEQDSIDALYVQGGSRFGTERIYGVLTRQQVDSAYRF